MNQRNVIFLLCVVLLTAPLFGCGTTMLVTESKYVAPDLPKSELATIKVDATSNWIQGVDLIVLRIMGKVALRKKIGENNTDAVDEILVAPGKQDVAIQTIYKSFEDGIEQNVQVKSGLSGVVKAGGIYLLKGGGEFSFELIDTVNDKVISKSGMFHKSKFSQQKPNDSSIEREFSIEYEF